MALLKIDKIHISKAAFLPKRVTFDENEDVEKTILLPKDTFSEKFKRISRLWPIFIIGCLISTSVIVVFYFFQSIFINILNGFKALGGLFKRKPKPEIQDDIDEDNVEEVSEEIIPELVEADVINNLKAQSNFAQVIQLKATSTQELESVVDELKEMVKGN